MLMEIFIDKNVMVIGVGFIGVYPAKKLSYNIYQLKIYDISKSR